jgi:phage minor structural protein
MLGDIDLNLRVLNIRLRLAKTHYNVIAVLKEARNISHKISMGNLNEVSFEVPFDIEIQHQLVKNPNIELLRGDYLIEVSVGNKKEWYVINETDKSMDDTSETKKIHAFSLGYELQDKQIRNYSVVSYNAQQAMDDALLESIWSVGYVDSDFLLKFRKFDVSESTVLDFLFQIADTFNGVLEFDTVNRLVHLKKADNIGQNKGLAFTYGRYLKALGEVEKYDEIVTRLVLEGAEGLSIQSVNPTGSRYIEDYSYYMFPFQRDVNRNVLKSSEYMSDALCHALLDYKDLVESKRGEFDSLLTTKEGHQENLATLETEYSTIETELKVIQDKLDVRKAAETLVINEGSYIGVNVGDKLAINYTMKSDKKYILMGKITDNSPYTLKIDSVTQTNPTKSTWTVLGKYENKTAMTLELCDVTGTLLNVDYSFYMMEITTEEFTTVGNESTLISTYIDKLKQDELDAKQGEIDVVEADIEAVDTDIATLRLDMSIETNFTPELIVEWNRFIKVRTWSDSNYTDAKDLYEDGLQRFENMRLPQTVFNISIVNFLEIIEEQRNWDKLSIGDTVRIYYEKFNTNITAKIIEINYNHESGDINLTIANTTKIGSDKDDVMKMIEQSHTSSKSLDMSKYKYDNASEKLGEIDALINGTWDATSRRIVAGINESVSIDGRGIIIRNPDFPNNVLIAQAGVLAISNTGGTDWKHAITAEGVVEEKIKYGLFRKKSILN